MASGRFAIAAMAALTIAGGAAAQVAPKIAGGGQRAVEDFARELVRGGRVDEAERVLALLRELGVDANTVGRVRDRLNKERRGTADAKKDLALATRARRVAAILAQDLPRQAGDPERRALADALLAFDRELPAAHEVFGRTATADGWLDAAGQRRAAARRDFATAVATARALPFALTNGPSELPIITAQVQDHGGRAAFAGLELHRFENPTLTATTLRLALRARALLQWIRTGTFEFEVQPAPPVVMTQNRARYLRAIDCCVQQQQLGEADAATARKATLFVDRLKTPVFVLDREELVAGWLLRQLAPKATNALDEGALNLVTQLLIGCNEGLEPQRGPGPHPGAMAFYTGSDANDDSYYAHAQVRGGRRFLATLGDAGQFDLGRLLALAPDQSAGLPQIQGTVACALLLELGQAPALFTAASGAAAFVRDQLGANADAAAIGAWLRPEAAGLAQQLDASSATAAVRREVDAARRLALANVPHKLHATASWNAQLDRGCTELLAERAGGPPTAAAAEAGLFAITAAGGDPAAAVRALLTSVADRTALLDVGTLELGAAFAGGTLAVDTGTLRHPVMTDCLAIWPSQGATDIPTRYAAGLPVPEANVDPATLGYPLTIQLGLLDGDAPARIGMRVAENGTENWLPCHRFDPERPLPGCEHLLRTYGLLPQQPLRPRTKYVFEVHLDQREVAHIVFTTGDP